MLNLMSARVLGGIGGAALQLKPLNKAARPNPVTGRFNQVAYCSVLSPGGRGDPKMEKKDGKTHEDLINETYGEGYGTRCDEEGFGGIYGANKHDDDDDKPGSQKKHEEYDKSQGCEVKEKEKGRNHPGAHAA